MTLEYEIAGAWVPSADVDVSKIRAYEMRLLRKKKHEPADAADEEGAECNRDERKGVSEVSCGRKSSGILAAVTPCLQIAALRPMYSSESFTQIVIMVLALVRLFVNLQFIIYDNACGVVRHLRKQHRIRQAAEEDTCGAWSALLALKWVIDRLHFVYHRGCRRRGSAWFVEGVDPAEHPELLGVDTEARDFDVEVICFCIASGHPVFSVCAVAFFFGTLCVLC